MTHVGPRKPVLDATASRKLTEALVAEEAPVPSDTFQAAIRAWWSSPEREQLAASTKKVWRSHIELIEARCGDAPVAVWNDPRMKAKVVAWRNLRKATPRPAHIGITVLVTLFKWAMLNRKASRSTGDGHPSALPGRHREEILWFPDDMERFASAAETDNRPWIADGLRLAALTGLRLADLVTLTFDHVGDFAISKTALKTSRGKRRRVTMPMTSPTSTKMQRAKEAPSRRPQDLLHPALRRPRAHR